MWYIVDMGKLQSERRLSLGLSDLQGKKEIAATTTNSDGNPFYRV